MSIWLTLMGMALVTYATRVLPLVTLRGALPGGLERVLRYVPPAIFAAITIPVLLMPEGSFEAGATLWVGLVGAVVAYRTRSIALTILVGLAVFWILRWLGIE